MVNGNFFKDPLIRSMKRAEYNTENCGHYALNLNSYSHTTPPIRRLAFDARKEKGLVQPFLKSNMVT